MASITVYSNTTDGWVGKFDSNNFATTKNAATGQLAADNEANPAVCETGISGGNYRLVRGFLDFTLSGIPAGATITAATVSLFVTSKENSDNDGEDTFGWYEGTQANPITTADYDAFNSTLISDAVDLGSITTSAYNAWTLNASGIAVLQAAIGGTAKLVVREGHDVSGNAYAGADGTVNRIVVYLADQAGTTNDPKLDITYTTPGGGETGYSAFI